jgi:hypothetical protein
MVLDAMGWEDPFCTKGLFPVIAAFEPLRVDAPG